VRRSSTSTSSSRSRHAGCSSGSNGGSIQHTGKECSCSRRRHAWKAIVLVVSSKGGRRCSLLLIGRWRRVVQASGGYSANSAALHHAYVDGLQALTSSLCVSLLVAAAAAARGFKALKQIVKLLFKLGDRQKMMEAYRWAALQTRLCDSVCRDARWPRTYVVAAACQALLLCSPSTVIPHACWACFACVACNSLQPFGGHSHAACAVLACCTHYKDAALCCRTFTPHKAAVVWPLCCLCCPTTPKTAAPPAAC
jgi:hypothetical protein